ncbi:MAG: response regulator transcription factor [Verrucomicrobiae bacterium]|nr:response regulator transcription factor [Verrucomicrobiae bacterium]
MEPASLSLVLADDEPGFRTSLRDLLRQQPGISLVGEASDGPQTIQLLRERRPDIAILDSHLPRLSAVDLLAGLGTRRLPLFIFVAHERDRRPDGYRNGTAGWLRKPVSPASLGEALRAARTHLAARIGPPASAGGAGGRITVKTGTSLTLVDLDSVVRAAAANNHCHLVTTHRTLTVREGLSALASRLPPGRFVRVNRSSLINVDYIATLESKSHGDWIVRLRDGCQLTISRARRASIFRQIRAVT